MKKSILLISAMILLSCNSQTKTTSVCDRDDCQDEKCLEITKDVFTGISVADCQEAGYKYRVIESLNNNSESICNGQLMTYKIKLNQYEEEEITCSKDSSIVLLRFKKIKP